MAAESSRRARSRPSRAFFWRRQIAQQVRSGLSQADFCRRKGISPGSLAWWKGELKRRRQRAKPRSYGAQPPQGRFVPVRLIQERRPGGTDGSFEVELRNGRRIRVPSPFDGEALGHLLAILEPPCTC